MSDAQFPATAIWDMATAFHGRPNFKWQRLYLTGSHRAPSHLRLALKQRVRIETQWKGLWLIELPL
jgi:hypothetical protein